MLYHLRLKRASLIKIQYVTWKIKLKKTLRKIKSTILQNIYSKLYPSGLCLDKFCGTTKIRKLSTDNVDALIWEMISNRRTATYQTVKY